MKLSDKTKGTGEYDLKNPLEAFTRVNIEKRLEALGYNRNEFDKKCNVYRERAKYKYQDNLLNGRNPDFLIYETDTSRILAVIEAKRPSSSLDQAIDQAIEYYAKPLNIPIVFVFNSGTFYACTVKKEPIRIDNIELNDFVDEKTLLRLIRGNFNIDSVPTGFSITRDELLKKFKAANNLLRKAGLRDGYERFSVFSDLMFLKLKDVFDDIGEITNGQKLDKACSWRKLVEKTPQYIGQENFRIEESEVKSYLEDTIKKKLKEAYGDVFESSLNIKEEKILIELIEQIDSIPFRTVDSDVKGDAFEFFLRNVTNGNKDLGEYYTPRHIVKMIVKLLNPIYGETIYDPCCGTGGFLLECFKYLRNHTDIVVDENDSEEIKKEKEKKRTFIREKSIYGRELTSTARIAKMNMILFGDGHTHIRQMDCLSEVVDERYDIVVSNIPYSQRVENGALYDFPTENGDSLFVQHIWKAVKKGGRIAVVVPDTFLYDGETYPIRKKIIEESARFLVISLPRGVFNPYTPTKTSVIVAYKKRNTKEILQDISMYVIRNDGFELGARRRPLAGLSDCNKFLMEYNEEKNLRCFFAPNAVDVGLEKITQKGYSLFPFEYMEHLPEHAKNEVTPIGQYIEQRQEPFDAESFPEKNQECVILSVTKNGIYAGETYSVAEMEQLNQKYKRVYPGDFTYNPHRINVGSVGIVPQIADYMYVSCIYPVFYLKNRRDIPNYYLLKLLKSDEYKVIINDYCLGGARADLKIEWLAKIKIDKPNDQEKKKIEKLSDRLEKTYINYMKLYHDIMR